MPKRLGVIAVPFGVTLALVVAWFAYDRITFQMEARKVTFDRKTIKRLSISGDWSVEVYNGSSRRLKAVWIEVTVPLTEVKRVFRLAPRGLLGDTLCEPFTLAPFRGDFGDFLRDPRIHGAWRLKGVEFSRKFW